MKPVSEELGTAISLLESQWFARQSSRVQLAIGVKLFRRNTIDTVIKRRGRRDWSTADISAYRHITGHILAIPGVVGCLSTNESNLASALLAGELEKISDLTDAVKNYRAFSSLVGPHSQSWINPAGSLRFTIASALMR